MTYSSNSKTLVNINSELSSIDNLEIVPTGFIKVGKDFQGEISGFIIGGSNPLPSPNWTQIQKFSLTSDSNATDVADLTSSRYNSSSEGHCSPTSGYIVGGSPTPSSSNKIEKFSFVNTTNSKSVGVLSVGVNGHAAATSATDGFVCSGLIYPAPTPGTYNNNILKFPFANDALGSDVGDVSVSRSSVIGQSSSTHGYATGGVTLTIPPYANLNSIERFPFASAVSTADVGDITEHRHSASGQSSQSHGYTSGGYAFPLSLNTIDKFPFATSSNASNVGDLTGLRYGTAGVSSYTSGYVTGGGNNSVTQTNIIDKFPFSTDSNATDIADLNQAGYSATGTQF